MTQNNQDNTELTSEYTPPVELLPPDPEQGLSNQHVEARLLQGMSNKAVASPSKSVSDIIRENICTYFNLVFTVIAGLLFLVGSFRNMSFYIIIVVNTLIGIFQELRSKKTLDKLQLLNAPKATVLRNGTCYIIPVEDLVLDDIVLFSAGNQISADAKVVQGEVQVNESLLTGESDEITKTVGSKLLSGSFIVSGSCRAQLTQVGADSYAAKLTLEAKSSRKGEQSQMIRALDRLVKTVGFLIIPIGIILFSQQFFFMHESLRTSVTAMSAAILGMIPEGLYLLASIALVVSMVRLAQKKVLVHDMKCIETLARVDVLCVDKTGTITENKMQVTKDQALDGHDSQAMPPLSILLSRFADSMSDDNATMVALRSYYKETDGVKPDHITSFSSTCKYSSATFGNTCYVLGAPEFVLRDQYEQYRDQIEQYVAQGYRTLVFGIYDGIADGKALTGSITALALVMLSNPIRKEAKQTFEYFAKQGVAIKVISGDNPLTVSEVAKQAGIEHADQYIDAATLKTEHDYLDAVNRFTVFGRVTPDQKRKLIKALKLKGHTVAMTGDGVNDILALKDADCSVAMASGSDAAAQAAQLVLLESDFACMPSVVLEGRRVVNNIQRSASLFLVKNIFSFLMSFFTIGTMITYPLEPAQLSLISVFTIGTPAFLLAMEPNKNRIEGSFLPNVLKQALPAGLTDFVAVSALVIFCNTFDVDQQDVSTACALLVSFVGLMILFKISRPFNKFRGLIWGCMLVGLIGTSIFLNDLFALRGISTQCTMLLVVFAITTEPMLRYFTLIQDKIIELLHKHTKFGKHI